MMNELRIFSPVAWPWAVRWFQPEPPSNNDSGVFRRNSSYFGYDMELWQHSCSPSLKAFRNTYHFVGPEAWLSVRDHCCWICLCYAWCVLISRCVYILVQLAFGLQILKTLVLCKDYDLPSKEPIPWLWDEKDKENFTILWASKAYHRYIMFWILYKLVTWDHLVPLCLGEYLLYQHLLSK